MKSKILAIVDAHVDEKALLAALVKEVVLVKLHELAEKTNTKLDDLVVAQLEALVAAKSAE